MEVTHETEYERPSWVVLAPHLADHPALTPREWQVLGILILITAFNRYAHSLLAITLTQVQTSLAIPESSLGALVAIVQLGAVPALVLFVAADSYGRRHLLLFSFLGYVITAGFSALAPTTLIFVILQFLSRAFLTAGFALAPVVVAEEFDSSRRGWGIGALGAVAIYGMGAAFLLLVVIEWLPFGWRFMFLGNFAGLFLFTMMRRNLPPSERFTRHRQLTLESQARSVLRPVWSLIKMYPGRFVLMISVLAAVSFGERAATFFDVKFLQDEHAWTPSAVGMMNLIGGFIVVALSPQIGRASDRFGRKRLLTLFLMLYPVLLIAFYNVGSAMIPPVWMVMKLSSLAIILLVGAFGVELFPTSYRSTATGTQVVAASTGAVLGLASESLLYHATGSHWQAVSIQALVIFVAPVLVWLAAPETSQRSLEDIAPER